MIDNAKCPFSKQFTSRTAYTAHFEDPLKIFWLRRKWIFIKEWASRVSYSSLRNGWLVYSKKDLNGVFSALYKEYEPISAFNTIIGKQWIIRDPAILQLVLKQYRNEKDGLFCVPENERVFIDRIVCDLYPEEITHITDRERELINSVIFTAESTHIAPLRSCIMGFMKQNRIQEYQEQLDQIANEIFDQLTPEEMKACDPAQLVFEFVLTVVCRLFTDYHASRESYQGIVRALVNIVERLNDEILQSPQNDQKIIQYENSLQIIRSLIDDNINTNSLLVKELKDSGLSLLASRMYLYFFYLAATETTSAALHYLFLQLGKDEYLQQTIRSELPDSVLLKKCIIEALRLNPPVYIIGRALRRDIMITLKNQENRVVWSKLISKGQYLVNWVAGIAKDQHLFPNPEKFNPFRFETLPGQLSWLPFSIGPHTCPGQFLAKAEMESFIRMLLKRFDIETTPPDIPIASKGIFTLHSDPDGKLKIHLKNRH